MTIQPIITGADTPILRTQTEAVTEVNKQTKKLIRDLVDTLATEKYGVGIAAPQIGVNQQVFVVILNANLADERLEVFINPTILEYSTDTDIEEEGCLSLPKTFGKVERAKSINIQYFNHKGKEKTVRYSGFNARLIQHEYDHLQGILFIDKLVA